MEKCDVREVSHNSLYCQALKKPVIAQFIFMVKKKWQFRIFGGFFSNSFLAGIKVDLSSADKYLKHLIMPHIYYL